jgi:HEAT repeat protein
MPKKTEGNSLGSLKVRDPSVQELLLDRIGIANPANAVDLILPLIRDPDSDVRGTAVCNLGLIHDDPAIPYLIEVAERDPSKQVRTEAIRSLSEYRSRDTNTRWIGDESTVASV